ncbi:hypothetical protein KSP40_PGU016462 [Platanthera guangdongensis]|uniref:Transmembrane protein n=1 Tax=Platanthera guangdongensis TaxID=2320717 RepID=A0ABR2N5H3_9ASPA
MMGMYGSTSSSSPSSSSQLLHLIFAVVFLSTAILSPAAHGIHEAETKEGERVTPNSVERAIGITGFNSHWEAFTAWLKLAWMNLRPPDSGYGGKKKGAGEALKEASKRSFQASKETVERTAETAAKGAGKAKEKLKRTVSDSAADL